MSTDSDKPFSAVMADLTGGEQVPVAQLFRLSDMTAEELDYFSTFWPNVNVERRRVIIRHLADISEENFQVDFAEVFALGLDDEATAVRLAALDGLWDCERVSLIEPIIAKMMSDPDNEVRAAAAATLGHYVLIAEWGRIPRENIKPVVEALLAQWDDPETSLSLRRAALESLGGAAHPRVARLIEEAYDSGEEALQLSAVFAMGRSADSRWLPIVIEEMESTDSEMRLEAARAAGGLGGSDAIPALADLISDTELEVRLVAVAALGEIGGELAQDILAELAEDPEAEDLFEAIEAALEEMDWLGSDTDFSLLEWGDDDELEDWTLAT